MSTTPFIDRRPPREPMITMDYQSFMRFNDCVSAVDFTPKEGFNGIIPRPGEITEDIDCEIIDPKALPPSERD